MGNGGRFFYLCFFTFKLLKLFERIYFTSFIFLLMIFPLAFGKSAFM